MIHAQWTFYGFGWKLMVVNILDIIGGWFLAGLALASLLPPVSNGVLDLSS